MDEAIKPGERVAIETKEKTYLGILMERSQLSGADHVVLKLDNGYNIGLKKEDVKSMRKEGERPKKEDYVPLPVKSPAGLPKISVLATGGTIASRVDYITGAVSSAFTAEELVSAVPEMASVADVFSVRQIFNKFSENMQPSDWAALASAVHEEISRGAEGVIVTHGTDTMGYTAAALSFMLKTPVPVVLTGAQRSSDRGSSDAAENLIDAATVAARGDFSGVCVVMHGAMSDGCSLIHPGTRARKMHASRRDAFKTVNALPIGKVSSGRIEYLSSGFPKRGGKSSLETSLEEKVSLLKVHPGLKPDVIDHLVETGCRGIVLEGTGLGHTSETLFGAIKNAVSSGVSIAMTSQTLNGRIDMEVYSTGRNLLELGVIPCEDMLPETAYVKLMWVLGRERDPKKISELMRGNLAGEISPRSIILAE